MYETANTSTGGVKTSKPEELISAIQNIIEIESRLGELSSRIGEVEPFSAPPFPEIPPNLQGLLDCAPGQIEGRKCRILEIIDDIENKLF